MIVLSAGGVPEPPEFRPFPKIARFNRSVVVTEKIDGTNAIVYVSPDRMEVRAGCRNRWISPGGNDNYGFAGWVEAYAMELRNLGPGYHYGEWWGAGIQRRYGLTGADKRFSLFNVHRWGAESKQQPPACCSVVPVLWRGNLIDLSVDAVAGRLRTNGSVAAPGFMDPEGFVVFHSAASVLLKYTLNGDGHKGTAAGNTE